MLNQVLDKRVPIFVGKRIGEPGIHVLLSMCLFLFSVPFESIVLDQGGFISVSKVGGYLFFLASLTSPRLCYRRPGKVVMWLLVYVYIFACAISLVSSVHREDALTRLLVTTQLCVAAWAISNLVQFPRFFTAAIWSLGIGSLFLSFLPHLGFGGMAALGGMNAAAGDNERTVAEGFDPNIFGAAMVIGCVAMVSVTQGRGRSMWLSAIAWVLTGVITYSIVKTGSRGSLVALLVGLTIIAFAKDSLLRTMVRIGIVVAAMLSVLILVIESDAMRARLDRALQSGDFAGRQFAWVQAVGMFEERPYLGWGPIESEYQLYPRTGMYYPLTLIDQPGHVPAHNSILELLIDLGLVGTIPFALAIGFGIVGSWRARSTYMGITPLCLLICAGAYNFTITGLNLKITWMPIAIGAGAYAISDKERKSRQARSGLSQNNGGPAPLVTNPGLALPHVVASKRASDAAAT